MFFEDPYTFGGLADLPLKKAKFVLLPVPYEATVSYQVGTKFGPQAIIHASRNMELYDEELEMEPWQAGIKTLPGLVPEKHTPARMAKLIEKTTSSLLIKDKFVLALGGEHSISPSLVAGYRSFYPELRVLHLDAHADLRERYEGTPYSHASAVRRILEMGCQVFSLGIRSISQEEKEFLRKEKPPVEIHWAYTMEPDWPENLSQKAPAGIYYLTFDLDFLDPSIMPDTGTPEPGGFLWWETLRFLRLFLERQDVKLVGADIVELAPKNFFSPACFLASRLVYKIIGYLVRKGY
ncbi:MAG: agmatinase [Candidatus Omnitrophica bacterium]|nr:agmatinase [Candidatus Omnitrophota bacterium]